MKKITLLFCLIFLLPVVCGPVYAEDRTWAASGDGVSWSDADNWFPDSVPISTDDVLIDFEDAAVVCNDTFRASSITLGGWEPSTLTSEDFVFGVIAPDSTSDSALICRKGGKIMLQGDGVMTISGKYESSNAELTPEPSFMFWLE